MQCTLLIPDLFLPRDIGAAAHRDLPLDALQTVLARSTRQTFAAIGLDAWLCQAFEVEQQRDWPVAPLTLTFDGGDPGNAYWLRADPVHLRLHSDQLLLADCGTFSISKQEADQFVAALNEHFAHDGLQFLAPSAERWYLRVEREPDIVTHALQEVVGGNVNAFLPSGKDALRWHKLINEIQMLLHNHPVNAARESKGETVINSVWLWGGGTAPPVPGRHFSAVWSDETLASALAARAGIHTAPLPGEAGYWLSMPGPLQAPDTRHLIVLGPLAAAARYGDVDRWRTEISHLNRSWLQPLLGAMRQRRVSRIALVALGRRSCERFELSALDLFKLWRISKPISAYGQ
jgi:hypothetical protein